MGAMAVAMKAMKAMKTMKAVKSKIVMKAKRVGQATHGRLGSKLQVFRGTKAKTTGGLMKDSLVRNKHGRVVSKRLSENGKERFQKNLRPWKEACMEARAAFNSKGFIAFNGKSLQGKALYAKAKAIYAEKVRLTD